MRASVDTAGDAQRHLTKHLDNDVLGNGIEVG